MKILSIRDWLADSVIVAGLTVIATYLLPLVVIPLASLRLHVLGAGPFWVRFVTVDLPAFVVTGCVLGLAAGGLIRHRKLSVAFLPSVLFCVYLASIHTFVAPRYFWGQSWTDFMLVGRWLLLIAGSLVCARFILRRRQSNTALEPTATVP